MSTTMTLSDLRLAVRQRSDMENSSGVYTDSLVKDPELNSYINQSAFELYDLLVEAYGSRYYISAPTYITTNGTDEFYPLPADFYKLAGISVKTNGSLANYFPLREGSFSDMERLSGINNQSVIGLGSMKYMLNANNVWLAPTPQAGQTVRMFYVPRLSTLLADGDTFDGISGWTEYIIIDAAIKCLQKEESDVSVLAGQKAAMITRINEAATNRDLANPPTVTDTSPSFNPYGFGSAGGWYP